MSNGESIQSFILALNGRNWLIPSADADAFAKEGPATLVDAMPP
jgi:hypothetical protein